MALEAMIFQQDPLIYIDLPAFQEEKPKAENLVINRGKNGYCDSPPYNTTSSPDTWGGGGDGFLSGEGYSPSVPAARRRKRRRTKPLKNKQDMENQRMTHIAVERNRRRQMNDYLAILRSLMPPSYAQRGDQASIVGGAINFVKELEQHHQFLKSHNPANPNTAYPNPFSNFFTFPQYSTFPSNAAVDAVVVTPSSIADVEVTMVESHANIKISTKRRPKQLLKMVAGFQSICLTILHLHITTVDQLVLYSFSVKVEDECELTTVNDIATTVHDMVGMIPEESICS